MYSELQVTTNFSFLHGGSHPDELVVAAHALGLEAIAVTDRNSLAGVVRAHHAAEQLGMRREVRELFGADLRRTGAEPSVGGQQVAGDLERRHLRDSRWGP